MKQYKMIYTFDKHGMDSISIVKIGDAEAIISELKQKGRDPQTADLFDVGSKKDVIIDAIGHMVAIRNSDVNIGFHEFAKAILDLASLGFIEE